MTNLYTEHETIYPVTKEAEEVLKNKAPMSVQLKMEQEKNRDLTLALKVTWFCVGVAIVGYSFLILFGFKLDPVVKVGCPIPMFQEIPLPILTPLPQ